MNKTVLEFDKKKLTKRITNLLNIVENSFNSILLSVNEKSANGLLDVYKNNKIVKEEFEDINKMLLESFIHSPFGKDLRRLISYLNIVNAISKIQETSSNLTLFLISWYEEKVGKNRNADWILDLIKRIINRLKKTSLILKNEDIEQIIELFFSDKKINELYKSNLELITKNLSIKTNDKNEKTIVPNELTIGYVLALKNIEIAGDKIKEIADMMNFIVTGKYLS